MYIRNTHMHAHTHKYRNIDCTRKSVTFLTKSCMSDEDEYIAIHEKHIHVQMYEALIANW